MNIYNEGKKEQIKVLVTAIGSVASKVVCCELKKMSFSVYGCDIYPKEWLPQGEGLHGFFMVPCVKYKKAYMDAIMDICMKNSIKIIIPLIDVEVDFYNEYRKYFEKNNIIVAISSKNSIDLARNKKNMMEFVKRECSFIKSIPTYLLNENIEILDKFPMVCKPINGRSSQNFHIVETIGQLKELKKIYSNSLYIVEPFISGERIVADVVRHSVSGEVVSVFRKELISTPHGCGLSVYIFSDSLLEEACQKLADKMDINGCVNFEFLKNEKGYYFLECNPRFSAGSIFTNIGGYNLVANHLNCFINTTIEKKATIANQYIVREFSEKVTKKE